jgi:hypothetical protein
MQFDPKKDKLGHFMLLIDEDYSVPTQDRAQLILPKVGPGICWNWKKYRCISCSREQIINVRITDRLRERRSMLSPRRRKVFGKEVSEKLRPRLQPQEIQKLSTVL